MIYCAELRFASNGGLTSGNDVFWLFLYFACECKENVRDEVYGCEHLVHLEIHLLHASHLQVNVDVFG